MAAFTIEHDSTAEDLFIIYDYFRISYNSEENCYGLLNKHNSWEKEGPKEGEIIEVLNEENDEWKKYRFSRLYYIDDRSKWYLEVLKEEDDDDDDNGKDKKIKDIEGLKVRKRII
ncbi:MAG: hypothetical protein GX219_07600 [Tissierellia bacterium]|nr:hypothetical protein [Tissierellia bacterium]